MDGDEVRRLLGNIEATLAEFSKRGNETSELLHGYGFGHSLAMSAVISLLIEKGVLDVEEVEERLLAASSLVEGRTGADTAKQAIAQIVHLIRKDRPQAN